MARQELSNGHKEINRKKNFYSEFLKSDQGDQLLQYNLLRALQNHLKQY